MCPKITVEDASAVPRASDGAGFAVENAGSRVTVTRSVAALKSV
jgi:hypothetical protein